METLHLVEIGLVYEFWNWNIVSSDKKLGRWMLDTLRLSNYGMVGGFGR